MDRKTSTFGPFSLDRERQEVARQGQPVPVGHRGYVILETLLDAGGEPVTKEALMQRAWPGTIIEEGNLTVQISALRRQLGPGADAMIVTVPRVGYRLVAKADERMLDRGGPPLIAVLPFANLGSNDEEGYFADGVADDIITALSKFKAFAVVSRGTTFALRERGADARRAAAEFGARYALEGSVRRMGDQLRVSAQLLDAATGTQLWAERYDGSAADIFSFQDNITERVVGVIEPTVRQAEIERIRRKPAANLDAYDLLLRALPLVYDPNPDGHAEAIALLNRSIELDPAYALPRAFAAWIYEKRLSLRARPLGNNDIGEAIALARMAMKLAADDPMIRAIGAWVLLRVADDIGAIDALRKAAFDSPNNIVVLQLAAAGIGLASRGSEECYRNFKRCWELSPGAPEAYQFLFGLAAVELERGNNEASIEWALKSLATFNDWLFTYIALTAAYANLDRMDEAQAMLQKVRELSPHLTIQLIERDAAPEDAFADAVLPGLRKAGLPER